MRNKIRLLKNLLVIAAICVVGYYAYNFFKTDPDAPEFTLEETPLHIESIRKIAEVATMSFQDEVVADTVEYFKGSQDKLLGNLKKLTDFQVKHFIKYSNIKRRLTLIVKGEARVGFDLTKNNYRITQNTDTIWFHFPKAKLLDVNLNPSETTVFQENGTWHDYARKQLMNKAKIKIERDVAASNLLAKAEQSMSELIPQIVKDSRKILVYYE